MKDTNIKYIKCLRDICKIRAQKIAKLEEQVKMYADRVNMLETYLSGKQGEVRRWREHYKAVESECDMRGDTLDKLEKDLATAKQRIEEQKTEISDMTMRRDDLQLEVEEIKERASEKNILAIIDYYILSNLDPDDTTKMSEFISKNIKGEKMIERRCDRCPVARQGENGAVACLSAKLDSVHYIHKEDGYIPKWCPLNTRAVDVGRIAKAVDGVLRLWTASLSTVYLMEVDAYRQWRKDISVAISQAIAECEEEK